MSELATITTRLRAAGCVFAEEEAAVLLHSGVSSDALERLVQRRVAGEPLEVVVGWAQFYGLRVAVDANVFVPRRRTELVVREALAATPGDAVLVDLCCGSGAIGAAMQAALPDATVYASDLQPDAVRVARRNLPAHRVFEGDLFDALPRDLRGVIDVLAVNAPYVPSDEIRLMPPEAREHEPLVTLDGGTDGLDLHRRIAAEAFSWLTPGGRLVIETSRRQAPVTAAVLREAGFTALIVRDEQIDATVVTASAPQ
ncbi:putative protein N(5)-glutamine methyltransferase [Rathayibacter sp. YIM 133350]|uniref:putative protein N(5)-glutamine methyltransferase n=1 Tax=Rathayibacter sp. YIM 133350 TaxID=3131992 RepID=UPI00307D6363